MAMKESGKIPQRPSEPRSAGSTAINRRRSEEEVGHFANYAEYSKTLRAWLVAYGIGAPVLFLTNDGIRTAFAESPTRLPIVLFFLLGVALQVSLAFVNKWCAWHMYVGEYDVSYREKKRYKIWHRINEMSELDFALDVGSIASFAYSTYLFTRFALAI